MAPRLFQAVSKLPTRKSPRGFNTLFQRKLATAETASMFLTKTVVRKVPKGSKIFFHNQVKTEERVSNCTMIYVAMKFATGSRTFFQNHVRPTVIASTATFRAPPKTAPIAFKASLKGGHALYAAIMIATRPAIARQIMAAGFASMAAFKAHWIPSQIFSAFETRLTTETRVGVTVRAAMIIELLTLFWAICARSWATVRASCAMLSLSAASLAC